MAAAALLALLQVGAPLPPVDWSTLPTLRYVRAADDVTDLAAFVRGEVLAGRCTHAVQSPAGWSLKVDLAVLATPDGNPRRVVPRAIDCPSVEQYAAGLVQRMARDNIDLNGSEGGWYRTALTFAWP